MRIIKARQAACLTTFASKRARSSWRADGSPQGADSLRAMQIAQGFDAPMPAPRALLLPLLPAGVGEDAALLAFMRAMGDERAREIEVASIPGAPLSVSRQIFTDHKTGESKLRKRGRIVFVDYLAETILRPDEAWLQTGRMGDVTLVLLARFLRGRDAIAAAAFFKKNGLAWEGWSVFPIEKESYLEAKRSGALVFRRDV